MADEIQSPFQLGLDKASVEFDLRNRLNTAMDMLIELREQRDQARDLRDDALKVSNTYSNRFVLAMDEIYEWKSLGAWGKFWSAGAVLLRVLEFLRGEV